MPSFTMTAAHALGREEALRRLKEKFSVVREAHRSQVSDLHEQWNGDSYAFAFKAMGMKVSGTVTVGESEVRLATELPFAAVLFKGLIEQRVREELGQLLA